MVKIGELSSPPLPQAKRSVGAGREVAIERNDSCCGCRRRCTADEDDWGALLKDQVKAVAGGILEYWRGYGDVARLGKFLGRGREKNDRGGNMGQSYRRGSVRAFVGLEREILNPTWQVRRLRARPAHGPGRRGNSAGMPDFAVSIPQQTQQH